MVLARISCRRETRATRCLTRIVLYTHGQAHRLTVDRRKHCQLVRQTSVASQFVTLNVQRPPAGGEGAGPRTLPSHVSPSKRPPENKSYLRPCPCTYLISLITVSMQVSTKCIAVRKVATPLRELTCHMGSHSVTCHPAEVTLLLCFSLGYRHSSYPGLSLFPLLSSTLPGPSASEATTLWHYTNTFINIFKPTSTKPQAGKPGWTSYL